MGIYGIATEAIMQCFILDEKLNKLEHDPADNCPAALAEFFKENYDENSEWGLWSSQKMKNGIVESRSLILLDIDYHLYFNDLKF